MLADFLLHIDLDVQLLYLLPQGIDTILFLSALPLLHGHRHRCLLLFLLYFAQNCVFFVAKELAFAALFVVLLGGEDAEDLDMNITPEEADMVGVSEEQIFRFFAEQ